MAIDNFIPTIWSARLLQELYKDYVFGSAFNRNYLADSRSGGNTVKIGTITSDITISDYSKNTDIGDPQIMDDSTQDLNLDQQKSFHFYVDDIDQYQSTPDIMSEAMRLSGVAIGDTVDQYLAGILKTGRGADTTRTVTDSTAFGSVTDGHLAAVRELRRKMKEANIFTRTRNPMLIVTPKFYESLEEYLTEKGATSPFTPNVSEDTLRNGFMGMLLGFKLMVSNNVPTVTANSETFSQCFAMTMDAATYADQITEIEAYRPEKRFGDAVKGLYVYGAKVVKPTELWELRIRNSA